MEENYDLLYRTGNEIKTIINPVDKGIPPAVVLSNPKFPHNVGGVLRACSNFGIKQLWFTGNRVLLRNNDGTGERLPREERMKGYNDVNIFQYDMPIKQFKTGTPVCVELVMGAENLKRFKHPKDAIYIFGPEDGSVPKGLRVLCHHFVVIPSKHCLNLSAAVNVVLYDRVAKQ